ncbi:MAG: hypothetical protein ACFFCW_13940 [Candidatus Hodarchaeota archaeon]
MIQVAAFWKKESKNNRTYYQGKIGKGRLLLFKNEKKDSEKHPDLILYIVPQDQEKREDRERTEDNHDPDIPF